MQLRPDTALRATIRSLTDVVLPAVDPTNLPAVEQLQIAIGLLTLIAERLPLEFRYDCDELERLVVFARSLAEVAPVESSMLNGDADEAVKVLARAHASPAEVLGAIRRLRETTGAVIGAAYAAGAPDDRERLAALVLSHADAQLTRERAWLLPQGWEPNPDALPSIASLLDRAQSARAGSGGETE